MPRMDTLSNCKHSWSRKNCLGVTKSVILEENDGFWPKFAVPTGFLPTFQGVSGPRMDILLNFRLGPRILDADLAFLGVLKSVKLERKGHFSLKMTVFTGFCLLFRVFEAENGYFIEFPT